MDEFTTDVISGIDPWLGLGTFAPLDYTLMGNVYTNLNLIFAVIARNGEKS
jgi:hypothetical protein